MNLSPGDFRIASADPSGTRVAVLGGSGEEGDEHTLVVLAGDCEGPKEMLTLSRSIQIVAAPKQAEKVGATYVRLAWSPDGQYLYAPGAIFRLSQTKEGLSFSKTRNAGSRYYDIRLGPAGRAIAVAEESARDRKSTEGEVKFIIELQYLFLFLNREVDQPLKPKEQQGKFWNPALWTVAPSVAWEESGAVLLHYPRNDFTERFQPGKNREQVDGYPGPRIKASADKITVSGECLGTWELKSSSKATRLRWKAQ
ncbi:MAG: hypothetical protein HKN21_08660 [Candidatus Eisenbacteria bacterium]|uniref:Uncharacterized protein n=1 Tax=Eiseniibacteriota bacterium TaxID=2212470 RepID=A0A7Y2EBJ8_UNCEI|nr:hypothetical protein [Candidatus Eisenbacteria bacterium]